MATEGKPSPELSQTNTIAAEARSTHIAELETGRALLQETNGVEDIKRRHSHRYRGHRAASFTAEDVNELVEIRARQRTFDGAYARTALGNLGYSITVLKLFDRRFYRIGLLYAVLAGLLFVLSFLRSSHSLQDFADCYRVAGGSNMEVIKTVGQTGKRIFGRPFVTAGWIVLAVSLVVLSVEIGLFVLVLKLCE